MTTSDVSFHPSSPSSLSRLILHLFLHVFSFYSTSHSSLSPSRLLFHHLLIALLPSSPTFSSKLSSTFYLYQNCPPSSPPSPTPRSPHTPVSFSPPSDNYCHHQRHIWGWSHLRVQSSHVDCIQHTTTAALSPISSSSSTASS